ncbi:MAG: hypothetical protein QOI46_1578 [Alphaproteobacteria bacterium]|jgi:hypothetical protein|nr:hypothetical protein [Alphaproteobacteria bacterium]
MMNEGVFQSGGGSACAGARGDQREINPALTAEQARAN